MVEVGARLNPRGVERVIRSDSGVAHRLSLSARVLSAVDSQVKAKRRGEKHLWRLQNQPSAGLAKRVKGKLQLAMAPLNPYFIRVLYGRRASRHRRKTQQPRQLKRFCFGYLLDKKPRPQYGTRYDAQINAIQA